MILLFYFTHMKYEVVDSSNPAWRPMLSTNSLASARKFAKQWNAKNVDYGEWCYECLITVTY